MPVPNSGFRLRKIAEKVADVYRIKVTVSSFELDEPEVQGGSISEEDSKEKITEIK